MTELTDEEREAFEVISCRQLGVFPVIQITFKIKEGSFRVAIIPRTGNVGALYAAENGRLMAREKEAAEIVEKYNLLTLARMHA